MNSVTCTGSGSAGATGTIRTTRTTGPNENLKFAFRQLYPNKKEYTWARQKKFGSRPDWVYLSPDLLKGLLEVSHQDYPSTPVTPSTP